MPRCPDCKKWYFLDPLISINDGSGRKVCEKCFNEHQIANRREFQQRCVERDDPSLMYLIPPIIEQSPISPMKAEPPNFEGKGGEMRYKDPNDPLNGEKYHTGDVCIEIGCSNPAGTAWSKLWCQKHNSERMDRISTSLEELKNKLNYRGK